MNIYDILEPLGGKFNNKFWIASQQDFSYVEQTLGFDLPDSYKKLVSLYGCSYGYNNESEIWCTWQKDDHQEPENKIDIFYGANTPDKRYDIVAGASSWLNGMPLLEFAKANVSDLFFIAEGGSVYFEPPQDFRFPRGQTRKIADTFDQFLNNLELRNRE